jgi:hypothetical protein
MLTIGEALIGTSKKINYCVTLQEIIAFLPESTFSLTPAQEMLFSPPSMRSYLLTLFSIAHLYLGRVTIYLSFYFSIFLNFSSFFHSPLHFSSFTSPIHIFSLGPQLVPVVFSNSAAAIDLRLGTVPVTTTTYNKLKFSRYRYYII